MVCNKIVIHVSPYIEKSFMNLLCNINKFDVYSINFLLFVKIIVE